MRQVVSELARRYGAWAARAFLLAALLAVTILVTTRKNATHLETALWEFILFGIGLGVSFYLGQQSVKKAAAELIRPQASAALRRLVSLGRGLKTIQRVVFAQGSEAGRFQQVDSDRVVAGMDTLAVLLDGQVEVVIAAMEDWREFAPDLVNELQEEGQRDDV